MKRKILIILVALTAFFTLTAFENDRDFEITVGDRYCYCYYDSSFDEVVARLNEIYAKNKTDGSDTETVAYDSSVLGKYFDDNSIQFFAVSKTDASQIRIAVYSDEISEKMQDLSVKSNKTVNRFAKDLISNSDLEYEIYSRDARKYIKLSSRESDSGGDYVVTQFITVCNGKVFNISFFNNSGVTSADKKILDTFEVKEATFPSKKPVIIVIIVAVAIALLICLIIYMIWGIIKSKTNSKSSCNEGFEISENGILNETNDEEINKE